MRKSLYTIGFLLAFTASALAQIVLTADQNFYVAQGSPTTGDPRNPTTPWPDHMSLITHIQQNYDLNGHAAIINNPAGGTFTQNIAVHGLLRGQTHAGQLVVKGAGKWATTIEPVGSGAYQPAPAEINNGAAITFQDINLSTMATKQDNLMLGKYANVVLAGEVRFTKQTNQTGENCISIGGFSILEVQANIWIDGDMQDFIQLDQYGVAYWNTNGQPNLLAMYFEHRATSQRQPIFYGAFIDAQSSNVNMQAVAFHGWTGAVVPIAAVGPRVRSRPQSIINIAAAVSTLPGNSNYYDEGPPTGTVPQGIVK
jgi:hypothetical protein